jgi:hypothetical protein
MRGGARGVKGGTKRSVQPLEIAGLRPGYSGCAEFRDDSNYPTRGKRPSMGYCGSV